MKPLQPPDSRHLRAAHGWLELGNHTEANEELERITPDMRVHPDVLDFRWHIYAHAERWESCLDLAETLIRLNPDKPDPWLHRSFALHELKRTQEAFDQLLPVVDKFPKVWLISYNLACYCAQAGLLDESKEWFKKAIIIDDKAVQRTALDDPDLKPLWDSMGGTFWKKVE
jgi:tetratricopeptide (TPR) repeat protein